MRDGGGGGSKERRGALTRFGVILGAHIRWEERELFEWLQATLSADDLREASETFAMRQPATPVACPTPQTL